MAFDVQQINPLDLQPSVGVGVKIPFSSDQVFTTTYTTKEALKSNLINYFLTGQSERFLNLSLGTGLRSVLFDQATQDKQDQIESIVRSGIATWFPNITINNLTTNYSPDTYTFTLSIAYSVNMTNISDQLVINFQQ